MKVYSCSEARRKFAAILDTARKEGVIITRRDGRRYKIVPLNTPEEGKSPLSIKHLKTNITTEFMQFVVLYSA